MKRREFLTAAARAAAGTMLLSSKSIVLLAIADPEESLNPGGMGMGRRLYPGRPNAQIGFPDRIGGGDGSWNSSHGTRGCSQTALAMTHGVGMFYWLRGRLTGLSAQKFG